MHMYGSNPPPLAAWLAAGCGGCLVQVTASTVSSPADSSRLKWIRRRASTDIQCQVHDPARSSATRTKGLDRWAGRGHANKSKQGHLPDNSRRTLLPRDHTCVDGSSGHTILLLATAANKPLIIDSAAFSYHSSITAIPVGLPRSTGT
jgi:hypothetical protein